MLRTSLSLAAGLLTFAAAGANAATPSDRAIVYATGSGGPDARPTEIYVRAETGQVRRLTNTASYEGFPSWSPDKTRIVFVRAAGNDADIYVMNADGTGVGRLAGSRRGAQDLYPAWSPDGRLIAFSSNRNGEGDVFVMRADGTGVRQVTRNARWVDDVQPRFSPSGRYLVFASNRVAFSNYELFRVRASDGRGATRLTFWGSGRDGAPGDDLMPEYSPDGRAHRVRLGPRRRLRGLDDARRRPRPAPPRAASRSQRRVSAVLARRSGTRLHDVQVRRDGG
jgi:Tol biopolymer transport system component